MCISWILTFSFNKWLHEVLINDKRPTFLIDKLQDIWQFDVFKLKRPSLDKIQNKDRGWYHQCTKSFFTRFVLFTENGCFSPFAHVCRIPTILGCNLHETNLVQIDATIKTFFVFTTVCYKLLIPAILKGKRSSISKEHQCCKSFLVTASTFIDLVFGRKKTSYSGTAMITG